jgi:hypothetical protein
VFEEMQRCLLTAVSGCEREREALRVPSCYAAFCVCRMTAEPSRLRHEPQK